MTAVGGARLRIGIIGAGTAGLATAIAFGRDGHEVHLFEKHPSLATLGAGLLIQPQGVAALIALGVGREFLAASVPVDHLVGKNHRQWTLIDIAYREHEARGVSRSVLARLLLDAALSAGASVHFGTSVDRIDGSALCIDERRIEFDLIVIANGASSHLPAQCGLAIASRKYAWGALWGMFDVTDWAQPRVLGQRFHTTRKMVGLMPTEWVGDKLRLSLFWSLPCAGYADWQATPLDQWKNELLTLWPEAAPVASQIVSHDQLAFASYHHARPSCLARPPVCIVGDAAHAMSPQLGLGSTLAVQDAMMLAQCVAARGAHDGPLRFSRNRLRVVRAYQLLSRLMTPCFQAESNGLLRDLAFASAQYIPGMRQLMIRSIAHPLSKAQSYHALPVPAAPPATVTRSLL